jgi:hypothetical protein
MQEFLPERVVRRGLQCNPVAGELGEEERREGKKS